MRLNRLLLWLLTLSVGLVLVIPIASVLFFDPNDFKPQLTQFIKEKTGLPLEIHGKIDLTLFPWVGLNVKDISLSHPTDYGPGSMLKIDEIDFKIPIKALLQRKFIIESLNIEGPEISFIKNPDGTTNFDYYQLLLHTTTQATPSAQVDPHPDASANAQSKKNKRQLIFALKKFKINHATITFNDNANQQNYTVNHLDLSGIDQEGMTLIRTEASFQSTHPLFKEGKFSTDIGAHLAKGFTLKNIDLQSNNMHITGDASLAAPSNAPWLFHLAIGKLNLDDLFKGGQAKQAKLKPAIVSTQNNKTGTMKAPAKTPNLASSRAIKGDITIDELQFKQFTMTNVKTTLKKENEMILLAPLTATLYEGNLDAKISHSLNATHQSTFQGKVSAISLLALLDALKQQKQITGKAVLDFNLAQSAQEPLNGLIQLQVSNGVINGIDLKYYFALARKVLSNKQSSLQDQKNTPFSSLTGTLKLHDHIIDNNDLQMSSPDFKASGEGSIFLLSQTIEYKLKAWQQSADYPLALRIKGPLKHPKVEPDLDLYLKAALKTELGKQLLKQLGDKNEQQENALPSSDSTHDQIKHKVSKELERGLKKLFKQRE